VGVQLRPVDLTRLTHNEHAALLGHAAKRARQVAGAQ